MTVDAIKVVMKDKISLIIVEDDIKLQTMLKEYFIEQQFHVTALSTGDEVSRLIEEQSPDVIILDLMLPGENGLSICRRIRHEFAGKIVMLTASGDDFDHVAALEVGADDFITKPIKPRVLLARVRAVLRRTTSDSDKQQRKFGALQLDATIKKCSLAHKVINLTESEFDVLWLLSQHANQPVSRDMLTQKIRGIDYDGVDRSIDNKIVSLRKKLDDDALTPSKIITMRGKGYLFASGAWENNDETNLP